MKSVPVSKATRKRIEVMAGGEGEGADTARSCWAIRSSSKALEKVRDTVRQ
jgi:hypothetical protein